MDEESNQLIEHFENEFNKEAEADMDAQAEMEADEFYDRWRDEAIERVDSNLNSLVETEIRSIEGHMYYFDGKKLKLLQHMKAHIDHLISMENVED